MRKLSRDPLREAILKCLIFGSIAATMNVYADCNVIYGVHDEGLNNSQFVTIDRNTYAVSPLGAINPGYDIEGLDMNKAHELYGSSGDDPEGHPAGHLYKISTTDGSPQSIGDICFDVQGTEVCGTEVSAISFNPVTDDLWGWSEECGLINIDIDKPEYSTLKMPYSTDDLKACLSNIKRQRQKYTSTIEDISWDSNGKKIYYANGNEVYVYTPLTGDLEGPLSGSGLSGNVETVEMLPDNDKTLILIVDGFHKLFKLDIVNDEVSPITDSNVKSYTDIEGIAACIDGTVETISCDKMDSNIFAKFNWDGIGYIADSSAINNDSITITADENGGTWSVTDANITHVIVNATDAIDIDGASSGTFGNSNGVTTVEFCGTPVEPPIVVTCDEMGSDVFAKFNWNGEGYVADDSADNNDSIVISGNDTTGTWTATNAAITHVIVNTTDANSVSSTTEGSFNNADGITTVEFCGTPVEECTTEVENKWLYATDASYDATGSRGLEIYGTAIHRDGDTITVAISANMTPENPVYYEGENTNFTDYVFDFGGTKYAVHFAPDNDSGANAGVGLYEVTTFKDVTKKNYGWSSFKEYNRGNLGDLPIHNNYFSWEAKRSVPQEIDSGTKVANDNYVRLTEAELANMGLDFDNGLTSGKTGTYTIGFSFTKTADMEGDFVSYVFTECINDGIALVNTLPAAMDTQSCPEPTPDPEICEVEEPTMDWSYTVDAVGDAAGRSELEIYSTAIKQDGDTIIVAINSNMTPEDPLIFGGENVNFTDFVFDFSGTKYAVHFAPDNDSGADSGVGLYENITLKDVTKKNYGFKSFKAYNRGDLGDLPIHNNYFSWKAKRSVPQEIDSGTKIANDNFTRLTGAELAAMGLNLPGQKGPNTFGFSFTKTADMQGDFIAYVFAECINDGIAMVKTLPATPVAPESCP